MRGLKTFALTLSLVYHALAQPEIQARIETLRHALKDRPIAVAEFPNIGANVEAMLNAAEGALRAERPYLALEKLSQATDTLAGARFFAEKSAAVKTLAEFDEEWRRAGSALTIPGHNWRAAPLALRALSEVAGNRTIPLLEGARGFANATQPRDGLFYLGEAQGQAEFARFVPTVSLPRKGRAVATRSLLPELLALQEKVNAAFQPPRSIEQHARFIALNSTLKLARELDASRLYAGALYQYLEAVRHFGMLDPAPAQPFNEAILRKFEASRDDDSLALLFLQRAASQAEGTDDERKSARVIAASVIPAYLAARKPAAGLPRASSKTIEITLVRWPYT
jgi:hypothetical protein